MSDALVVKFVDNLRLQNDNTAETVEYFLKDFDLFASTHLKTSVSEIISKLRNGTYNAEPKEAQPYDVLQAYSAWLKKNRLDTGRNNARTVRLKLDWVVTLLENNYIIISRRLYRKKVRSEKPTEPDMTPATKKGLVEVLTAIDNMRLRALCLFEGSMGWRITETLTMTLANLENFDIAKLKFTDTPFINASGKHAKTKKGKRRQLTAETAKQIEKMLAHTYRGRTIKRYAKVDGKIKVQKVVSNPKPKATDRIFTPYHCDESKYKPPQTANMHKRLEHDYHMASGQLRETIDRLGIGFEDEGKRRKITFHTFRRFCYRTCTNIVHEQYAKHHTGRKVHEYAGKPDEEIAEDFATVEPYLTFLDATAMEEKQQAISKELQSTRKELTDLKEFVSRRNIAWEKATHPDWSPEDWAKYYDDVGQPTEA